MVRIAPGSPIDIRWTLTEAVATCLDAIHTALERHRSQAAAPMSEEQELGFWNDIKGLAKEMEELRSLAENLQELITAERSTEDDPELTVLDTACKRLCEAIGRFGRRYEQFSRSRAPGRAREIQAAVAEYRKALAKVGDGVEQVFPSVAEKYRAWRVAEDPLAARADEVRSRLGLHSLLIDAICQADGLRVALPREADERTFELRELVNPILLENKQIRERLRNRPGKAEESCDTVPESSLPEYSNLATERLEHEQCRVIVDCLLILQARHGPEARTTRKELVEEAAMLADQRGVSGMGRTNAYNKLNKLVDLNVIRKIEAAKSRYDQNASHGYRLSLPAQARYASRIEAVRDDFATLSERNRGSSADD